jgi:mannose-6-phosphate isomerase-like protein (cupin superfamily)
MAEKNLVIASHDIRAIAGGLSPKGRGKTLSTFNNCKLGVARFSSHPLWERHPASDELLQVFEGELDLTVLSPAGPIEMTLRPGSVFVVPKGLWHSPRPRGMVSLLFMSNDAGSEISNKKDPRRAA